MSAFTNHFSTDEAVQALIEKMATDIALQRLVLNHQPHYAWVEQDGTVNCHTETEIERVWVARRAVDVKAVIALDEAEKKAAAAANQRLIDQWPNPKGSTGESWESERD